MVKNLRVGKILGFYHNLLKQAFFIGEDKVIICCQSIDKVMNSRRIQKIELERLHGLLNFVAPAVAGCYPLLSTLIDLMNSRRSSFEWIKLKTKGKPVSILVIRVFRALKLIKFLIKNRNLRFYK